jgi:hypothetical protein
MMASLLEACIDILELLSRATCLILFVQELMKRFFRIVLIYFYYNYKYAKYKLITHHFLI